MNEDQIIEQAIQGHASTRDAIRWAMQQEREACAKVVEQYCGAWDDEGYALTQAIRARGEKPPVKTYCGGKPNYCTPVDAVKMTPDRVDETAKGEHMIDCTDEQLMEEVRRRGFVIRDAQVGAKWVGLTGLEQKELMAMNSRYAVFETEARLKEKNR